MERFIVGTGRCGSTLLSNMLSCHPDGLVLSECLGGLDHRLHLKSGIVSRHAFKSLLADSNPFVDISIRRHSPDKEILSDIGSTPDSIPALLVATLPFLTRDPGQLLSEILNLVETFPDQTMGAHYNQLFSWLQSRFNKQFWIERSGDSVIYLPALYQAFPKAKFVHIHRHGPEVVMSMSKHSYLSLVTSFFTHQLTPEELAETEYGGKTVSPNDPISQRLTNRPALEDYSSYWNYQVMMAYQGLARMHPDQVLDVRFETLVAEPQKTLETIATFLALPDNPGWIDKASAMVDKQLISSSLESLSQREKEQLDRACSPGQLLLNRHQHPWVYPTLDLLKPVETTR